MCVFDLLSTAVYFEMGDFDKSIETCVKAVDHGRDIRADYQLIAKYTSPFFFFSKSTTARRKKVTELNPVVFLFCRALARAASAYSKKGDHENAVVYYGKSLAEHRTPEIQTKLRESEKARDQKAKESYINPQLADEAREQGNALFKEQKFAEALKSYTEATKRNPKDPKNFSNRAAAYAKLMALPEALKDAEEAIKLDPAFSKEPHFHFFGHHEIYSLFSFRSKPRPTSGRPAP